LEHYLTRKTKVNFIGLKGLYQLIFKVWRLKFIKIWDRDEFQFCILV